MILPSESAQSSGYRLKRGTKSSVASTLTAEALPPLSAIDGPFQLAEYLTLKVRADPHDVAGLVEVPAEGRSTDRDVWIYEHLRRLPIDLTPLVSSLLTHCTKEACPEMKADQWQYLCVAHGLGVSEECCAIDYILHTLDSATAILNSTKNFPSRMSIPPGSLSHFPSLSRRLSRIFSHAYFHHREQFLLSESETSLYARFVALCEAYGLVGNDLLIIPHASKAEESTDEEENGDDDDGAEAEDDDDEDEDRTRDKEKTGGKRTLSLDRQSGVGFKMLSREKGKGKVTEAEADAETRPTAVKEEPSIPEEAKVASPPPSQTSLLPKKLSPGKPSPDSTSSANKKPGTLGRGTMGRGKQGRGTVLWSSDSADVPAVPQVPTLLGGQPLERTESRESAIYIGQESEENESADKGLGLFAGQPKEEAEEAELPVPKDEIELLEEAGKLDVEPTVSPLPPSGAVDPPKPDEPGADVSSPAETTDTIPEKVSPPDDASTESVKSVSFIEAPTAIIPPTSSPTPTFPETAATSPLNPPRSLSRSPEARHKALSGSSTATPTRKAKEGSKSPAALGISGLPKIETKTEDAELDAEGSKALPPVIGSPVAVKKGEGKEVSA